jgi:photosystem II stability/assembly factor-like uncharacterized protein
MLRKIFPILAVAAFLAFLAGCGEEETPAGGGGGGQITQEKYDTLYSLFFLDVNEGWAVGDNSAIIHTLDGGKTWESQTENVKWLEEGENKYILWCLKFTDSQTGWIVGGSRDGTKGVLLKTTDGGATWTEIELPAEAQGTVLRSITLHSDPSAGDAAWIVGLGGLILYSSDGGNSWVKQDSPVTKDLYSVASIGYYRQGWKVWAVGQDGTIIYTSDGITWEEQQSGIPTSLQAVFFTNTSQTEKVFKGWAIGVNGVIRATSDFGQRWSPQDADALGQHLRSIFFVEKTQTGWIVGDGGLVRYTNNGGRDWRPRASGVFKTLYAVHFVNTSQGWAVGKDGVVIHTTTGGSQWEILRGSAF